MSLHIYRIFEEYFQEFRSKSLFSRNFLVLIEGFEHSNVNLILVQKFSGFFISLGKAVEIFGNFLRITHQITSLISNVYLKLVQIFPNFLSSLYRAFGTFRSFWINTHLTIFPSLIFILDR